VNIVALVPFDIYPPQFGGAQRCAKLLERIGEVTVVALDWNGEDRTEQHGDVTYHNVSARQPARERAQKLLGMDLHTFDGMAAFCQSDLTHLSAYIEALEPDLIILEHPWLLPFVGDTPFIYDAHNAEAFLTSMRWPGSVDEQVVKELEHRAVKNAKAITYCSELDAEIFRKYYNPTAPMHFIPNGTDLPDQLAEGKEKSLLFVGSQYGPNVRAAQELANLAYLIPDYTINIVGGCGRNVRTSQPNVKLWGHVDDDTLDALHRKAFAFVNLMHTGSGTSLKVARAMSYGIPVISSAVGARGYESVLIANTPTEAVSTLAEIEKNWDTHSKASRTFAEKISWDRAGVKLRGIVGAIG
jgi:glycosyltransferase involved in cell wall biosynthesis